VARVPIIIIVPVVCAAVIASQRVGAKRRPLRLREQSTYPHGG